MNFENQDKPKSRQEIINVKIMELDKIQIELDNLLDSLPNGEIKTKIKDKVLELRKKNEEIIELISDDIDLKKTE